MKIPKETAIALLSAILTPKASNWPIAKLNQRMGLVTSKVAIDAIPEEFHSLYEEMAAAQTKGKSIEVIDGEVEEKPAKKPTSKKAPAKKKKATAKKKAPAKKKTAAKKPAKKAPAKKPEVKKPAAKKASARKGVGPDLDRFGSRPDSICGKVNAVLLGDKEWHSIEEIAEAVGCTVKQARHRLYHMRNQRLVDLRHIIQYKVL